MKNLTLKQQLKWLQDNGVKIKTEMEMLALIVLHLNNNQLKEVPNFNLPNLKYFYFYNNQLKKVPNFIEKIPNTYVFPNLNWNDFKWINKILKDELTAEEVFAIDNIEHRRIAYEYMDKAKMKQLKDYKVLDEQIDEKGNPMKILSFTIQNMKEPLKFYNCVCPSSKREYFIGTNENTCKEAKAGCWGFKKGEVLFVNEW